MLQLEEEAQFYCNELARLQGRVFPGSLGSTQARGKESSLGELLHLRLV